jgi:acetyl-CoA carboxylase biotin carboxyl carrier protein
MKAKEIRDLIDFISKSGLEEVNIETQEFKIAVKKSPTAITAAAEPAVAVPVNSNDQPKEVVTASPEPVVESTQAPASDDNSKYVEIKSPMIGTFYASPNPESGPFVSVGDTVKVGQTVCIVEAMKLFNEIESEVSGKIVKLLVEDASPIEFDQPLFLVDPS